MSPVIDFPEYAPDLSPFQSDESNIIQNVYPRKDGYQPAPTPAFASAALAGTCHGYFYARNADSTIAVFAGTATKLYKLNNTTFAWADVSKGSGSYSAVPATDQWQFAQFNNFVFATQTNTVLQVYDLTSSTNFADNAGSPPQARYIAVVGRFLVLSGLGSSTPYRIQWSGLNDTTNWTSGVNSSDFQDLPDGGPVRGVAGGEFGVIMQDNTIRQMTFVGGTLVFQIQRISQDRGIFAPLSLCQAGERVFYIGVDGFRMYVPGGYPVAIGKEKIDRTFFLDVDKSALNLILGASDPSGTRVFFAYKSLAGNAGFFDKVLVYDYFLDRWSIVLAWMGEAISTLAKPGLTLEGLDSIAPGDSIDALTISLDSFATASTVSLSMFDTSHRLAFLNGPNAEALLDTSEHEQDNNLRMRVQGLRPITDASGCFGSLGTRETTQSLIVYSPESAVQASNGRIPMNVATRMARGRLRVPAGTIWTFATGVEAFTQKEGQW